MEPELIGGVGSTAVIPAVAVIAIHFAVAGGLIMLVGALITFLVVILILYLINLLPIDGRAKQICRVVVIILGVISLLKYIAVF
ncbi:hypothetical protein V1281_003625 [Nitrobacteraceae bacterium AZCC 2161]